MNLTIPLEENVSVHDILYNFYDLNIPDTSKIQRAIENGYVIPKEFVPLARKMYMDGLLSTEKRYIVAKRFYDPEMQPLKKCPHYEQNPKYPLEYPRPIDYERKNNPIIEEEIVEEQNNRKWYLKKFPKFVKWHNKKIVMRRRLPIPKKRPRTPLPVFNDEELQKMNMVQMKSGNEMEIRSIKYDMRSENEVQFARYEDMNDFPKKFESNFLEIDVQLEVIGRAKRIRQYEENKRVQTFFHGFSSNLGCIQGYYDIKNKQYREEAEKENLGLKKRKPDRSELLKFVQRKRDEEQTQKEKEMLSQIEPLPCGEEADRELMRKYILGLNSSTLSTDSDDEQRLRIVSSGEESGNEEMPLGSGNRSKDSGDTIEGMLDITNNDNLISKESPLKVNVDVDTNKLSKNQVVHQKTINPWLGILSDAEEIFVRHASAPHSRVSSTSSFHDGSSRDKFMSRRFGEDGRRKSEDSVNLSEKDQSVEPVEMEASTSSGPEVHIETAMVKPKKPRGRPRKRTRASMELLRKAGKLPIPPPKPQRTGDLDSSVVTKRRGRPRKKPLPSVSNDIMNEHYLMDFGHPTHRRRFEGNQPDIVVESSIPAPQPHQFPRPDLEPFVASPRPYGSSFMGKMKRVESHPNSLISTERVKCLAAKERDSSETRSIITIHSETDEPKRKGMKFIDRLVDDNDDDMSSTSSVCTPTFKLRAKRSYLSKNNPTIRQTSVVESDEDPSRASSVSGMAGNRAAGGVVSRASSLLGEFEELTLPKSVEQFQDPLPPPEVLLDEECEPKPDLNDFPIPPPINSDSRKSMKRIRNKRFEGSEVKIEEIDGNDVEVMFSNVNVKDEDDILLVDATYKVPKNYPTPVIEQDVFPPKPKCVSKEKLTHEYAVNKFIYDGLNELFMADPAQFSLLVLCLLKDEKCEGTTFKISFEIKDRKSKFTDELITYISTSSKDGIYPNADMKRYSNFTGEFRKKCTLPEVLREGLTPMNFFQIVERIIEVNQCLKNNLSSEVVTLAERELLSTVENIMIGRFVESTFKLASLSNIEWATKAHIRRRFELLLNGWKEFLRKGGFLRVLLSIDRDDIKPVNEGFKSKCREILDECESNVEKASELLDMSEEELAERMAKECEVSKEELEKATKDMKKVPSETHTKQCVRCKNYDLPIYFSTDETFDIHSRLHGSSDCNLCYEDCPNATGIIIHAINSHYSILRDNS